MSTGSELCQPVASDYPIMKVSLSQLGLASDRKIAWIDANADLWITLIYGEQVPIKIATLACSVQWNPDSDALACITDAQLRLWYYPNVIFIDKSLSDATAQSTENVGHNGDIHEFSGNRCAIRRQDGAIVNLTILPYQPLLFSLCSQGQWAAATRLARFVNEGVVWSCLAAMAIYGCELDTAEQCFAAIDAVDKLFFHPIH